VSGSGGYEPEMSRPPVIDDELCEAVLAGNGPVPHGLWGLASFAEDSRALRTSPAPTPDAVLQAMFDTPPRLRSTGPARTRRRAHAGAGARVVVGASAALMALTGAAAAGVLPGEAQHAVVTVVNSVSPFPDLPDGSAGDATATSSTGGTPSVSTGRARASASGNNSASTSTSSSSPLAAAAQATSDPTPTLDAAIAADMPPDWAPAAGVEPPGQSGETGPDRAATTPAGGNGNGNANGSGNGDGNADASVPQGKAKGHDKS
jgi:hypothetical protein